ncbi:MAG: glycerophosphodiester phosphodiesterase [Actinomycetota bacterium]
MAHRGASKAAPANTLAAFRLARDMGAHAVELDVRQCASGELVVHHDPQIADGRIIIHPHVAASIQCFIKRRDVFG